MNELRKAAQMALKAMGLVSADLVCQNSHHGKADQHEDFGECPIQKRWHETYDALRSALNTKPAE